jgi:hypothetical protein
LQVKHMLRIRGTVGQWPVDLMVELEDEDWAKLGAQLKPASEAAPAQPSGVQPAGRDEKTWQTAMTLLQTAGPLSGPQLLEQLSALTGSTTAGKRLLVRLRHSANVKVDSGADAPLYSWVE